MNNNPKQIKRFIVQCVSCESDIINIEANCAENYIRITCNKCHITEILKGN